MKGLLEFDLNDPDDTKAHLRAANAVGYELVLYNMFQKLREVWKYSDNDIDVEHAEKWRDVLAELCIEYNITVE